MIDPYELSRQLSSNLPFDVTKWSVQGVADWISGLDIPVDYSENFLKGEISGSFLPLIERYDLEEIGIEKLGHQLLLLKAIRSLCSLPVEIETLTLQKLIVRILNDSKQTSSLLKSRNYSNSSLYLSVHNSLVDLTTDILKACSWFGRMPFIKNETYLEHRQEFLKSTAGIRIVLSKMRNNENDFKGILLKQLEDLKNRCREIILNNNDSLFITAGFVARVTLICMSNPLNEIEFVTTQSGSHVITNVEPMSNASKRFEIGDEIIEINGQVVVGWNPKYFARLLNNCSNTVEFLLKKMPSHRDSIERRCDVSQSTRSVTTPDRPSILTDPNSSSSDNDYESHRHLSLPGLEKSYGDHETDGSDSIVKRSSGRRAGFKKLSNFISRQQRKSKASSAPASVGSNKFSFSPSIKIPEAGSKTYRTEVFLTLSTKDNIPLCKPPAYDQRSVNSVTSLQSNGRARVKPSYDALTNKEYEGWLLIKAAHRSPFSFSWCKRFCVLENSVLYIYRAKNYETCEAVIDLDGYTITAANELKTKYTFKVFNDFSNFYFRTFSRIEMVKWMNKLSISAIHFQFSCDSPISPSRENSPYVAKNSTDSASESDEPSSRDSSNPLKKYFKKRKSLETHSDPEHRLSLTPGSAGLPPTGRFSFTMRRHNKHLSKSAKGSLQHDDSLSCSNDNLNGYRSEDNLPRSFMNRFNFSLPSLRKYQRQKKMSDG